MADKVPRRKRTHRTTRAAEPHHGEDDPQDSIDNQLPDLASGSNLPLKKPSVIDDEHDIFDDLNLEAVQILQDMGNAPPLLHHDQMLYESQVANQLLYEPEVVNHPPSEPEVVNHPPSEPEVVNHPPVITEPEVVNHPPVITEPEVVDEPAMPGSRRLSVDSLCLSKTLPADVTQLNGKLLLDPFEASLLLDDPGYIDDSPTYQRMLLAFDEDNRQFNLLLSVITVESLPIYSIDRDWSLFVRLHDLRSEDEVMFFRVYDDDVADDYFYVLRYFKKPRRRRTHKKTRASEPRTTHHPEDDRQQASIQNEPDLDSGDNLPLKKRKVQHDEFHDELNLEAVQIPPLLHHDQMPYDESQVADEMLYHSQVVHQLLYEAEVDNQMRYSSQVVNQLLNEDEVVNHPPYEPEVVDEPAMPGSRRLSLHSLCLSKPLLPADVTEENGKLLLDAFEASQLLDDPGLMDEPSSPRFERMLLAFDEDNRQFNLLLSVITVEFFPTYSIDRDWSSFVRLHDLRSEDEIMFFRVYDDYVADDFFYVLRYFKKPRTTKIDKAGVRKGQLKIKFKQRGAQNKS